MEGNSEPNEQPISVENEKKSSVSNMLVVDDERMMVEAVAVMAKRLGGVEICDTALTGPEALTKFANRDLVLSDFDLGEPYNGVEILKKFLELNPQGVVALQSGRVVDDEDILRAIEENGITIPIRLQKGEGTSVLDVINQANKILKERENHDAV